MDSTSSSQSTSNTETSQLPMTSVDALAEILPFLDLANSASSHTRIIPSFYQYYAAYMEPQYLPLNPIAHLYEQLLFSRGHNIIPPTPETIYRPLYFLLNVNLSLEGIRQPVGMRIHIFTTSDSKEIRFDEIVSMAIELLYYTQIDVRIEALEFLKALVKNPLHKLTNLRLSGFLLSGSLFASLSKLSLDWLHLIHPMLGCGDFGFLSLDLTSALGFTRLHMEFRGVCDLSVFPKLPSSLKEFSLHISGVYPPSLPISLHNCTSLKKM